MGQGEPDEWYLQRYVYLYVGRREVSWVTMHPTLHNMELLTQHELHGPEPVVLSFGVYTQWLVDPNVLPEAIFVSHLS